MKDVITPVEISEDDLPVAERCEEVKMDFSSYATGQVLPESSDEKNQVFGSRDDEKADKPRTKYFKYVK